MAKVYDEGDVARISNTFYNFSNVATNPTSVVLRVLDPAGTTTTPSPTSDGSGVYHYDLTLNLPGKWYYRWEGTGTLVAATPDGEIVVSDSRFV